jgi:hypothetical protein
MSLTYLEACDEMKRLFWERWQALSPGVAGSADPVLVQWPGEPIGPPKKTQPFARFAIRHTGSRQTTFGPTGQRRFTRVGFVVVQCFGPVADAGIPNGGLSLAENLAIIARDAYEGVGTGDGLWFRNVRVAEITSDKSYYQQQLRAEFQYDEMK